MSANKTRDFSSGNTTLISESTRIVGDLHFAGNLEIEGQVTGNVLSSEVGGRVRVLPAGVVTGDIHSPIAIINGRIEGNIYSSEEVHLVANSCVEGNLYYVLIEIEKGAQINGTFVYQPNPDGIKVLENDDIVASSD
ncbi:MAG: cytoskeletal protein CcmA (bactofilin family) [Porticoccus sp.]|jgi:cytoskeletal protein CcmA (bactofilin family)